VKNEGTRPVSGKNCNAQCAGEWAGLQDACRRRQALLPDIATIPATLIQFFKLLFGVRKMGVAGF
jgi:hypothetical protein